MDLRQLEYFVAVAEEANFTRAAARVHVTQSGVSAQIRQLERELGAPLFDRSTRRATLTPAGVAALQPARAALAAAAAVRRAVDDVNGLVRGRLSIAMVTACTVAPLFDALASFHREHPGVELSISEAGSDDMVQRVREGVVDVALVGCASAPPHDLESRVVADDRLVALVPAGHPLAGRRSTSLTDLVRHPLVCLPTGTGVRTVLDRACADRGVAASITAEASAPAAVADLARRGLGVAVLSSSMTSDASGLAEVRVRDLTTRALLALVWRRSTDRALQELLRHCDRAFEDAAA
jgi:DNA-binding transcriptional LysR family regulator